MMNRKYYLILGLIIFTVLSILAFDFYVLKFGKFWDKKPSTQVTLPTPSSQLQPWASNPLVQKAKEIGYNIIWMDPNDTIGRTVFYDWRGAYGNGGIGPKELKNPDGTTFIRHITGLFKEFQDIPNSKEKYLLLSLPNQEELLTIRISFEFKKFTSNTTGNPMNVLLGVENLNLIPQKQSQDSKNVFLSSMKEADLRKMLKPGDVVAVSIKVEAVKGQKKENNYVNTKDEKDFLIGTYIYLRRFGGWEQIDNELNKN